MDLYVKICLLNIICFCIFVIGGTALFTKSFMRKAESFIGFWFLLIIVDVIGTVMAYIILA